MGEKVTLRVWRGDAGQGQLTDYQVEANEGEVLLDILHRLQATQAGDLAVRWNCKAGKCGSCSMEINGRPRLACMTRMSTFEPGAPITVTPVRTSLPRRIVVCPTRTPGTSVIAFHRPGGYVPTPRPTSRARGRSVGGAASATEPRIVQSKIRFLIGVDYAEGIFGDNTPP